MIDALVQLAFNLHSQKGVYALLLGSGISRGAGIPTGWEVILDLSRRLAAADGEHSVLDPAEWYRQKFKEEPSYTKLLDALARSPAERQQILRGYFEPSEEERQQGVKVPTKAHRSIAALAAAGHIRVILTTNFDRLLETALADAGVVVAVLATPDAIDGAVPLVHSRCYVVKLHGDYLDTRIKNTPAELAAYDVRLNRLLDRVLDDFGLIVCGWSGEWDSALRDALLRVSNHRYTTYWAARGEPIAAANELIAHRQAIKVPIQDAELFFVTLKEKVQALDDLNQPHPLSASIAVATVKRYLEDERHRIRLHDLVLGEVNSAIESIAATDVTSERPFGMSITRGIRTIESALSVLLPTLTHGVYWNRSWSVEVWPKALERLLNHQMDRRLKWESLGLLLYPGALAFFAMGLIAVETQQFQLLHRLYSVAVRREGRDDNVAVRELPPVVLANADFMRQLEGLATKKLPLNVWMYRVLEPYVVPLLADGRTFELLFDRFEILLALSYPYFRRFGSDRTPPGCFAYRERNRLRILQEIQDSLRIQGTKSPYCAERLFGANKDECEAAIQRLREFVTQLGWD